MYAKLVTPATYVNPLFYLRDIGRLITSATPSTSLLSAFSQSSSIVYDSTAAGWTYVGSNHATDQPTIATSSDTTAPDATSWNFCFSAPCLSGSTLKYLVLNLYNYTSAPSYNAGFTITAGSSASSVGVVTNETPRIYVNSSLVSYATRDTYGINSSFGTTSQTYYLIANQRHCTLICENTGMVALWESSMTNAHTFYGIAPFVMHTQYVGSSSNSTQSNFTTYTGVTQNTNASSTPTFGIGCFACNVTNPNNGTNYGLYDIGTNTPAALTIAQTGTIANYGSRRTNTIDALGNPKYVVSPIYYSMQQIGYPTQYVTGIVPIYWTTGAMGTTGDTVVLNNNTYTFFNVCSKYGVIINTSAS
jgi:hypothetical protein